MNAIIDSTKTTPKKRKMQIQIRVAVQRKQKKKKDKNVFPIVVPGTPDQPEQNKTERAQQGQNQDEDLTLYYKVFNRYRPEAGESNAESAARTAVLEAEYQYLLMKKKTKSEPKKKRTKTTQLHSLSPSTPPRQTVRFNKAPCPTIKPITIQEDRETLCLNNVQDITIDTDYYLYPTPDRLVHNNPIDIIYDTGAAISMLPADYSHAWANLRECLHTLTGCFSGQSESNLLIGEFHGILTLDSKEPYGLSSPNAFKSLKD
jgi:hypothetical protein